MGTRNFIKFFFDYPNGLMSGFGGAKRDRTADLLHAMQALSQLSYGPVSKFSSAESYRTLCRSGSFFFFLIACWAGSFSNKKDPAKSGSLFSMNGVPTGIRTPVATVKG